MENGAESILNCNSIKLANLPDFSEVEKLHKETAPSSAAYELIHGHCVVISTISWQIAHHCNMLLSSENHAPQMSDTLRKRAELAKNCLQELVGDSYAIL
ncbi:phosphohydrolase, partial [Bifidobacteriaceae bacterium NR015]